MTSLPVVSVQGGGLAVVDDHGELIPLREATDHVFLRAVKRLTDHDAEVLAFKRAMGHEARERFGVGTAHQGGFDFVVREDQRWPDRPTREALEVLLDCGSITQVDFDRAMPMQRKPDARALKSLLSRLMVSEPNAAKILADACSVGAPSVRDVRDSAIDATTT